MRMIQEAVPNKFSHIVNLVKAALEVNFGYSRLIVFGCSLLKKN